MFLTLMKEGPSEVSMLLNDLGHTRATKAGTMGTAKPKGGANPEIQSQLGLSAATRRHERGMLSNRVSTTHGEYWPSILYTPPVA